MSFATKNNVTVWLASPRVDHKQQLPMPTLRKKKEKKKKKGIRWGSLGVCIRFSINCFSPITFFLFKNLTKKKKKKNPNLAVLGFSCLSILLFCFFNINNKYFIFLFKIGLEPGDTLKSNKQTLSNISELSAIGFALIISISRISTITNMHP